MPAGELVCSPLLPAELSDLVALLQLHPPDLELPVCRLQARGSGSDWAPGRREPFGKALAYTAPCGSVRRRAEWHNSGSFVAERHFKCTSKYSFGVIGFPPAFHDPLQRAVPRPT